MTRTEAALGKLAAVALLLLLLVPPLAAAAWALAVYRAGEEERAGMLDRYDRLRAVVASGGNIPKSASGFDAARYLLGGGPPSVLAAGLQSRLRDIASAQGVEVLQASETKPRDAGGLAALGVSIEMSGPAAGVHAVLDQIESSVPWLFIGKLQLRSSYVEIIATETEPPLVAVLEVWGLAAAPAEPAAAP